MSTPRRWPSRNLDGERGSGTVLALGVIAALALLTAGALLVLTAMQARAVAQNAADLGALAAARALQGSTAVPCAAAAGVVAANGAALGSCQVQGEEVVVQARAVARGIGAGLVATAAARAGPAR